MLPISESEINCRSWNLKIFVLKIRLENKSIDWVLCKACMHMLSLMIEIYFTFPAVCRSTI